MEYNFTNSAFMRILTLILSLLLFSLDPGFCAPKIRESPVVKAVLKASPAVVNISSEYSIRERTNPFSGFDPFFDSFFKDFFEPEKQRRPQRSNLGSGVIIDGEKGLILTNSHVISSAETIKISLKDEREFDAHVVGADPDFDLAVLRIRSDKKLPDIQMGTSKDLMIGETVIAIGNPFGFSHTVTTGVISALNRSIRTDERIYHEFIQIDASINPGNSGGPLLNINGDLIGINTAIYAKAQGIGFAIPISKAKKIISDLIEHGEVIQAWIGIKVQNINPRIAQYMNFSDKNGVLVKTVSPNSPADKSGLQVGDVILSIGSRIIQSKDVYQSTMRGYSAGDTLKIKYWRKNKKSLVSVVAQNFPHKLALELAFNLFGVNVSDLSLRNRIKFSLSEKEGVVITDLLPDSYLSRIGAKPGDIIRQLDDFLVSNLDDFKNAVIKCRHKKSVVILLQRGGRGYYVSIKI